MLFFLVFTSTIINVIVSVHLMFFFTEALVVNWLIPLINWYNNYTYPTYTLMLVKKYDAFDESSDSDEEDDEDEDEREDEGEDEREDEGEDEGDNSTSSENIENYEQYIDETTSEQDNVNTAQTADVLTPDMVAHTPAIVEPIPITSYFDQTVD